MFEKSLGEYDGLLLTNTKQIHMFWMRFPIDVLYVKRVGQKKNGILLEVVEITERMKPWAVGKWISFATDVIELREGTISKTGVSKGTLLLLKNREFQIPPKGV
ncbi:DUF192 domain-containing protein [Tepidibacillus marianensis]|uniref:DUF192 domain-containing protein n=1 Tax=Tepidibacillus marianensis TaxID=3131995 RepID=UPI0030CCE004